MNTSYKVREFAKLAAVTIRTLHHYEQVGLLKPRRTIAGYRLYSRTDLERLEQIVALKFLGLPLQQIKILLDRDPPMLPEALQVQLTILEKKRQLLDGAIGAIRDAVSAIQAGKPVEVVDLKRIIGAIKMQNNADFMKKYFSRESWAKLTNLKKQLTPESPLSRSRTWIELLCDVQATLGSDYASKKAQLLAARWMKFIDVSSQGDSGIQAGWTNAWLDRKHWPAHVQAHVASHDLEKISQFIGKAILSLAYKKYYSAKAWVKSGTVSEEISTRKEANGNGADGAVPRGGGFTRGRRSKRESAEPGNKVAGVVGARIRWRPRNQNRSNEGLG